MKVKILENKESEINPLPMQKEITSEGYCTIGQILDNMKTDWYQANQSIVECKWQDSVKIPGRKKDSYQIKIKSGYFQGENVLIMMFNDMSLQD